MSDQHYMRLAIDLAKLGMYTTAPNPRVGCVLVCDNAVIGQGYHRCYGEAHAEVNALADVSTRGGRSEGATAYVTLEPCSHTGNTPPCCDALIDAKVARVVIAMADPNPLVAGQGISRLQAAGIIVEVGLLGVEARALNPGFIKRMETGRPWVRVKLAMSLDGRTAMASGESQWITGTQARRDVQGLRARSCAIVSGVDTIIADDASLTVRAGEMAIDPELAVEAASQQPLRVVLDSSLRLPASAKLLSQPGPVLIAAAEKNLNAQQSLEAMGADVVYLPDGKGRVDLSGLLELLANRNCNEVMVEAGSTLAGALTEADLVDQYTVYLAATLMGSSARPLLTLPLDTMAQQRRLKIEGVRPVGEDWRIDARTR